MTASKGEKWFGWVISGLLGLGALVGIYKILPYLITFAHNTLVLGVYAAVGVAAFYGLVLNNGLRNLLINGWKRLIRFGYILLFNIDPLGGLRVRISELKKSNEKASEQYGVVKGQIESVDQAMVRFGQKVEKGLGRMKAAQDMGQKDVVNAEGVKVGVAQAAIKELEPLKQRMLRLAATLDDVIRKSRLQVEMLEQVVDTKESLYKVTKAGRSAFTAAFASLKGDTDKDELFQMNLAFVDEFAATAVGEMDGMLDMYRDTLNGIDLDARGFSNEALDLLEQRQAKVSQILDRDVSTQALLPSSINQVPQTAVPQGNAFQHLFKR